MADIKNFTSIVNGIKNVAVVVSSPIKSTSQNREEQENKNIPKAKTPTAENVLGYFARKINPIIKNNSPEAIKLKKLFLDGGIPLKNIAENEELINKLSKYDYDNIKAKFEYCKNKILPETGFRYDIGNLKHYESYLTFEELNVDNLKKLYENGIYLREAQRKYTSEAYLDAPGKNIILEIHYLQEYENFDFLSTAEQKHFIKHAFHYFSDEFINNLSEFDDLMKFSLIRDLKRCGSGEELEQELLEKIQNKPISSISIDEDKMSAFFENGVFEYEMLQNSIGKVDLEKYKKGFPLQYPREKFIEDFNSSIKDLTSEEQKQVFGYYGFSIDSQNDIVKFPVPTNKDVSAFSPSVQKVLLETNVYVNNFMLNNKIVLDEEDIEAQEFLNSFIEVFPEFISIIGKIQHRGDGIDCHTIEVLQNCINNPQTSSLSKDEQCILFMTVMFHDIAKKEKVIDSEHQKPSAYFAKEIIKKAPISHAQKERIYNLIMNSHWATESKSEKDLGAIFRHKNDFKIAQIIAKADAESAGFKYLNPEDRIKEINENIAKIQSSGIALFADNLPSDTSKFPKDSDGIKYLDLTDKEEDLTKYGFAEGVKVKDLNFLVHSTYESLDELNKICDDSKEICLSSSLLSANGSLSNYWNGECSVILDCVNSDIALGGINVGCTGGQRGFEHFKDYVYMENNCWESEQNKVEHIKRQRQELVNYLKTELDLTDEEYLEFYLALEEYDSKRKIEDITLKSGRKIDSKTTRKAIEKMQAYVLKGRESGNSYPNEVVVFQPKIQAVVMSKEKYIKSSIETNKIKQDALKNNIPIVLV